MKLHGIVALLLWSACGDDGEDRTQQPVQEGRPDASASPDARTQLDSALASELRDAGRVADAEPDELNDAAVEHATAPDDAGADAFVTSYTQPSIPRDSLEPVCLPMRPRYGEDSTVCLDSKCIPGSLSAQGDVQALPGFWCRAGCASGELESHVSVQGQLTLHLDFNRPIDPHSSSAGLRDALYEFSGETQEPNHVGFVGEPSLIEELRNEDGRLYVAGWGMVTSSVDLVPTLPYLCGSHAPTLCTSQICEYVVPDYTHPASWIHFEIEAPFTRSPDGTN